MGEDANAGRAFEDLGAALREATKRLHQLDIDPAEKLRRAPAALCRLLAITNVGKRDLATAVERLQRLRVELDAVSNRPNSNEFGRHTD